MEGRGREEGIDREGERGSDGEGVRRRRVGRFRCFASKVLNLHLHAALAKPVRRL